MSEAAISDDIDFELGAEIDGSSETGYDGFEALLEPEDKVVLLEIDHQSESRRSSISSEANDIINSPRSTAEGVQSRQDLFMELLKSPEKREMIKLARTRLASVQKAAQALRNRDRSSHYDNMNGFDVVHSSFGSFSEAAECSHDELRFQEPWEGSTRKRPRSETVSQLAVDFRTLVNAKKSLLKSGQDMDGIDHDLFGQIDRGLGSIGGTFSGLIAQINDRYQAKLEEYSKNEAKNTDRRFREPTIGEAASEVIDEPIARLKKVDKRLKALIEITGYIEDFGLEPVSINPTKPESYQAGANWPMLVQQKLNDSSRHRDEESTKLVRNSSLEDAQLQTLASGNMSGKSVYLEQHHNLYKLGQSIAFVPAQNMNIHPKDTLISVNRGATDAENDLSALGTEIVDWIKIFKLAGPNTLITADETYSTISPDDQYALLIATVEAVRDSGAKMLMANHSELFIEQAVADEQTAVGHFETIVQESRRSRMFDDAPPDMIFTHELKAGADDSRALQVASYLGLPDHIVKAARAYMAGEELTFEPVSPPSAAAMRPYSELERTVLKSRSVNPDELFNQSIQQSYGFNQLPVFDNYSHESDMRGRSITGDNELWHWMINQATTNPAEILERQELFSELMDSERRWEIAQAIDRASDVLSGIFDKSMLDLTILPNQMVRWNRIKHLEDEDLDNALALYQDLLMNLMAVNFAYDVSSLNPKAMDLYEKHGQLEQMVEIVKKHIEEGSQSPLRNQLAEFLEVKPTKVAKKIIKISEKMYYKLRDSQSEMLYYTVTDFHNSRDETMPGMIDENYRSYRVERWWDSQKFIPATEDRVAAIPMVMGEAFKRANQTVQELKEFKRQHRPVEADDEDEYQYRQQQVDYDFERNYSVRNDQLIAAWDYMLGGSDPIAELLGQLDKSDSIYLAQAASYLRTEFGEHFSEDWRKSLPLLIVKNSYGDNSLGYSGHGETQKRSLGESYGLLEYLKVAERLDKNGFKPPAKKAAKNVKITGLRDVLSDPDDYVANDAAFDTETPINYFAGAGMSGKTQFIKAMEQHQLSYQSTGFAPSQTAHIPIYDVVAYVDRASQRVDRNLSAYGNDIMIWKRLIERLEDRQGSRIMLGVDEPISTTSPRYQEALVAAISQYAHSIGALALIPTHNHQAVDKVIKQSGGRATAWHFGIELDESNGTISYSYKLQPGHDSDSNAIAVARTVHGGLPESVTTRAQEIKDSLNI